MDKERTGLYIASTGLLMAEIALGGEPIHAYGSTIEENTQPQDSESNYVIDMPNFNEPISVTKDGKNMQLIIDGGTNKENEQQAGAKPFPSYKEYVGKAQDLGIDMSNPPANINEIMAKTPQYKKVTDTLQSVCTFVNNTNKTPKLYPAIFTRDVNKGDIYLTGYCTDQDFKYYVLWGKEKIQDKNVGLMFGLKLPESMPAGTFIDMQPYMYPDGSFDIVPVLNDPKTGQKVIIGSPIQSSQVPEIKPTPEGENVGQEKEYVLMNAKYDNGEVTIEKEKPSVSAEIQERNAKLLEQPKISSKFEFPSVVPGTVTISVQGKDIENMGGKESLEKYGKLFDAWRVLIAKTGLNVSEYPDPYHHSPAGLDEVREPKIRKLLMYTDPKINFVEESYNLANYSEKALTILLPNHGPKGLNVWNNFDKDKPGANAVKWEKVNMASAKFDVQCVPYNSFNNGLQLFNGIYRFSYYKDESDIWNIKIGTKNDPYLNNQDIVPSCLGAFMLSGYYSDWTVRSPGFVNYTSTAEESTLFYNMELDVFKSRDEILSFPKKNYFLPQMKKKR